MEWKIQPQVGQHLWKKIHKITKRFLGNARNFQCHLRYLWQVQIKSKEKSSRVTKWISYKNKNKKAQIEARAVTEYNWKMEHQPLGQKLEVEVGT